MVRSVTLSSEQQSLARLRVAEAGHSDTVQIDLLDYRNVDGEYDAIVSVEMIEAVGHQYWATYFRVLDKLLAPGGRVALQAITMPHDRMLQTRNTYTWVHKYIFPGGFLPSTEAIESVTAEHTALRVRERLSMGQHYAETLRLWKDRFAAHSAQAEELGFDETFRRMWHFYLCYSEAGFRSGYIDVQQFVLDKSGSMTVTVAAELDKALRPLVRGELPVHLTAWDGSTAGPVTAPKVVLRSPDALRRLLWSPGELGAAQAYVTGEIDVEGDLGEALAHVWAVARERGLSGVRPSPWTVAKVWRVAAKLGVTGGPLPAPAAQANIRGRLHSRCATAPRSVTTTTCPTISTR